KGIAQACYAEMAPRLVGPDGEKLTLRIDNSDSAIPQIKVSLADSYGFSEATHWSIHNLQCATLLHESLHLLGLVAENPFTRSIFADETSVCRREGPGDSIMNEPEVAYFSRNASLLHAGEFRALTRPGCLTPKSEIFYACSREANKRISRNNGMARCFSN